MQTYSQVVNSYINYANALSDSPHAEEVKKRVSIEATNRAEEGLAELLKQIGDPELRELIDSAVGRISYAYEKLGFIEGFIAERSLSCLS